MSKYAIIRVLSLVAVVIVLSQGIISAEDPKPAMSPNKQTVQTYMDAFNKLDHAAILACLTDDVEWFIPGAFRVNGKPAFNKEITNDAFVGIPIIKVSRMTEENNLVICEGSVRCTRKDGGVMNLLFCDVFELQGAKIKRLTSYLMETK